MRPVPIDQLYEEHVVRLSDPDACWGWSGHTHEHGYGMIGKRVKGRKVKIRAHRYAFEKYCRSLLPGEVVRHSCDNPPCTNPRHLLAGTQVENMEEMWAKGRGSTAGLFKPKLTAEQRSEIVEMCLAGKVQTDIAARFGVSQSAVSLVYLASTRV